MRRRRRSHGVTQQQSLSGDPLNITLRLRVGRVDPEQTSRTDPSAAKWTRQTSRTCCEADNISCCRHRKFPTTIYVSARPSYKKPNSKRGEQDRMQCRLCSGTGAVKMSGSRRSRQTGRTPARALSRDCRSSALRLPLNATLLHTDTPQPHAHPSTLLSCTLRGHIDSDPEQKYTRQNTQR